MTKQVGSSTPFSGFQRGGSRASVTAITRPALRFCARKPTGAFGAVVLVLLVLTALLAGDLAPYGPNEPFVGEALEGPGSAHYFGTDNLGRDILSRVIAGARPSLYTGLVVVAISVTAGTLLGVTSAYAGGAFDILVQRVVDGFMALPGLVIAMAVVAVVPTNESWSRIGSINVPVAIALVAASLPGTSRVIRSSAISLKQTAFVEAARTVGAGPRRILARHMVPNVMAPAIVLASVQLGGVILAEASLSFLGLGTPPPAASWGRMMSQEGRQFLEVAWWIAVFPGIAISLVVLSFNLLGDALRDVLDPRMRGT